MADKRINALATTAPNTASDDFFAVDGTTNGTRKLNAFSPTFGGNATVTGTLTVNGTTASVGAGTGSIISKLNGAAGSYKLSIYQSAGVDRWYAGLAAGAESGSDGGAPYSIVALTDAGAVIDNALLITRAAGGSITTPRPVSISATTASTSTSSGALVVGNGTSGGLGVGGAASIGGPILVGTSSDVYLSRTGAGVLDLRSASTPGTLGRLDINGTTSAAVGFRQTGSRDWFITAESFELRVSCLTAASIFAFNSGTPVAMRDSTASTSTSSGALVVSGGVGVAGAINCGSGLVANPLFTQTRKLEAQIPHTVSTEDYLRIGSNTGSTNTYAGEFGYGLTAGGSPQIRFNRVHAGTVTTWLTVPTSTGDAEFAGSVKTAAPSGGTAANWKLGTVATVSPTSPNRTIEVDIGGTIYYIHAKTTNN